MSDVLAPIINTLNAPFWEGAREGRLMLPYCAATGRAFWPPGPVSPYRDGAGVEWRETAPRGSVRSLAVYRRVFVKAFEALTPYAIALIELEKGVRLQAHVSDPQALRTGDRVALSFRVLIADGAAVLVASKADD